MQKDAYIIWHLLDNEEFDDIIDKRLGPEVNKYDDLLEFEF
jgi:hypothetical protein